MRRSLRLANRSADGVFAYLERKPELHQAGGAAFLPPLRDKISFENVTLESGSGRVLFNGLTVEILGEVEDLDHGPRRGSEAGPRLPDPPIDRPQGRSGPDRRRRPPRRDPGVGPGAGRHRATGRPGLLRHRPGQHRPGRPELRPPSGDRGRQGGARPPLHPGLAPGLRHPDRRPSAHYLKPDQQYRIALARAFLHDPSIVIIEEPDTAARRGHEGLSSTTPWPGSPPAGPSSCSRTGCRRSGPATA